MATDEDLSDANEYVCAEATRGSWLPVTLLCVISGAIVATTGYFMGAGAGDLVMVLGVLMITVVPIAIALRVRNDSRRLAALRAHGAVGHATAARVVEFRRGSADRWWVIVNWRDTRGRAHTQAVSRYNYDPTALLDVPRIRVLHDPQWPRDGVVDPTTLPSCYRHRLPKAERALVKAWRTPAN